MKQVISICPDRYAIKIETEIRNSENCVRIAINETDQELIILGHCELDSVISALKRAKEEFENKTNVEEEYSKYKRDGRFW